MALPQKLYRFVEGEDFTFFDFPFLRDLLIAL